MWRQIRNISPKKIKIQYFSYENAFRSSFIVFSCLSFLKGKKICFSFLFLCTLRVMQIKRHFTYNPLNSITILLHSPFMLCALYLFMCDGTYSPKSILNDRFFQQLFMSNLFYYQSFVTAICWEEIVERNNFFYI